MKEENKPDWDITAKYLAGESDKSEQERIRNWENQEPANPGELDKIGAAWNLSGTHENLYKIDEDKAWIHVKSRITQLEKGIPNKSKLVILSSRFTRMAAGILLLAAIATGLYLITSKLHSPSGILTVFNEESTPLSIKLSDGSTVSLNKGARLDYPEKFTEASREVTLTGEAFFDVRHDEKKPFTVHTSRAIVRDLGTSFNISAYKEKDEIRVIVESGKVELVPLNLAVQKILLEKGNFGSYHSNELVAVKGKNQDINYLSWKTRLVRFENTPMSEVADVLAKTYHSDISIASDKLRTCRFTGTFSEESLDTVIKVLQTAFNLKIDTKDKKLVLTGKGC